MAVRRAQLVVTSFALFGFASMTLASCGDRPPPAAAAPVATALPDAFATCDEMKTGAFDELEVSAPPEAGARLRRLLVQAHNLVTASVALEQELIDACAVLAKTAGAFDEELKQASGGGHGAERVCTIAANKASKVLEGAKPAKVKITLDLDRTHCFTATDAVKKCLADCGSPATKGDDRASCTGGELYGTCRGRCSGACANEGGTCAGTCWGVCRGKCDKEFRGSCGGKCNGTCNGRSTHGPHRCVGICDGSCTDKAEGICAGRCDGGCAGLWEPKDLGKCDGICTGACIGDVGPPVCTGEFNPPGVDPICQAMCAAGAGVSAGCNAPLVRATLKGGKQTAELQKVMAGLQAALPRVLRVQEGTSKKLPRAMDLVTAAAINWSNAYATSGAKPLACVRAALDAMKASTDNIDIAVKGSEMLKPVVKPLLKPAEPAPAP